MSRAWRFPIGDIAEPLVSRHYGGGRRSFAQKAWDVRAGDELLQVKALRLTGSPARARSPVRSDDGCTAVVVVVFDADLRVDHALRIPREVVNELFPRDAHVNGRVVRLGRRLLEHPGVSVFALSDAWLDG